MIRAATGQHQAAALIASYSAPIAAGLIALLAALVSWFATNATLGLPIASVVFASLIVPPFIDSSRRPSLIVVISVLLPFAIVWLIAFLQPLGIAAAARMLVVLASYLIALAGIAALLGRLGVNAALAAAVTIGIALAWLSWPIWLSGHLSDGSLLRSLVVAQPIFAINGASESFGVWTQQHEMYRLTALGQDVPFSLPRSVLPCAIAHGLIGVLGLAGARPKTAHGADVPR